MIVHSVIERMRNNDDMTYYQRVVPSDSFSFAANGCSTGSLALRARFVGFSAPLHYLRYQRNRHYLRTVRIIENVDKSPSNDST